MYIAFEGDDIIGFMPVKSSSSGLCIDNYYIKDDREDTISAILYRIEEDTAPASLLTALVHNARGGIHKTVSGPGSNGRTTKRWITIPC